MATRQGSANKAKIYAVMGASGSGKSSYVKGELARTAPRRLLVWDYMREYGAHGAVVSTLGEMHAQVSAAGAGPFALVFQPGKDPDTAKRQFDVFCRIAHAAGSVTMVVEELAFVTSPSKAPPGWSMCTLTGRHEAMTIYGLSQRPASVDKNFFSNATHIRTGRLNFKADQDVLADALQVQRDEIQALLPLQWIERDMSNGKLSRGGAEPVKSAPPRPRQGVAKAKA
jgi:hypothetical protein